MKNRPLTNMLTMHFKEFFREPEILFWTMGFPILLTLILGLAFVRQDMTAQHIGVVIPTQESQANASPLQNWMTEIETKHQADNSNTNSSSDLPPVIFKTFSTVDEALVGIKRGNILLFIRYDPVEQKRIYSFDPQKADARLMYRLLEKPDTPTPARAEYLKAIGSRYIDFLIPGLIALGILQSCMWAIGWGLIDRRIKKMLRRMAATPMNKYMYLLSYLLARLILSAVEIAVLLFFAMLVFKIQIEGSLLAFLLIFICGNFSFAGISVLTASRAKNSQVGNGLINAVSLPMMIMSGIFFSYKSFPAWLIPFIEIMPLTMLANSFRKIFIEGAGLLDVAAPAMMLTLIGTICLLISQKIFKWY